MNPIKLTASIVLYHSDGASIQQLIASFQQLPLNKHLYLIDHSSNSSLSYLGQIDQAITYHFMNSNRGYGKGHNTAMEWAIENQSTYHLVLNPDIEFEAQALLKLIEYMQQEPQIGLLMPKVLYPSGENQYLCKMLPSPFDLLGRRFLPSLFKRFFQKQLDYYECRHLNYNFKMDVPNLSGCFMLMRTEALKKVGLFDPRFFMYLEDTDLCRRINALYRTVYYPEVQIVHVYEKGSYRVNKLLFYHIQSAILYFNKWGWFFDKQRRLLNKQLKNLTQS